MKYSQEELLLMEPVEIYKLRLSGTIERFPRGLFLDSIFVNVDAGIKMTKYLIEDILHWSDDEICKKLTKEIFHKYKLNGMLDSVFDASPYQALEATYPGRFKAWQLSVVPHNFWNEKIGKEATIWMIEEKLKWTDEEICEKLNTKVFIEHGLNGMIQRVFDSSPYQALENAYPGKFKPWELKYAPAKYWTKETAKEATIWMIEEKLKWTDKDICEKLSKRTFFENSLGGMLQNLFCSSPYQALDNAYPGKFKPWELYAVAKNYWTKETAREATRWLIEEKLRWTDDEICKKLNILVFVENKLNGMMQSIFSNSPYQALDNAYPGKFKPWQLSVVGRNYWNKQTTKEATKWLIEEKLKWTDDEICQKISVKTFKENGLGGMILNMFKGSPYLALENAYQGKFKKSGLNIEVIKKQED